MEDAVERKDVARQDSLRLQIASEKNRHNQAMQNLAKEIDFQENLRNSTKAGIRSAIEAAKRMVDPFVVAEQAAASVFNNMNSALDNFVETGKFKFGAFAKSVIADLAKIALKAAATRLLTSVFGGIFGRAAGGPVMANKPYIVGEQGPELFVPNSAGSIMTNASMNKNASADSGMGATITNNYITNNISAIDSRSVAQMFVENRKSLLGASMMARKEMPYGG
jgi:lambda family phage tail tape measure protein